MKRFFLILLGLGACSDSGVGPSASTSIAIHLEAERIREATIASGDSIRLTLRISGESGSSSAGTVHWSSNDPTIARLSQVTSSSVMVHGGAFGTARVVATAGALTDSVVISVLSAAQGGHCESGGGLELSPGQSYTATAAAAATLCLARPPAGGAEFVYVPFNAALASQRLRVEIAGEGIEATASPSFSVGPVAPPHTDATRVGPEVDGDFDRRLREREARELTPLIQRTGPVPGPRTALTLSALPAVGDTLRLNVNAQQMCAGRIDRLSRIVAISDRAIVIEDTTNPAGGFTTAEYQSFASAFDQLVYPTITTNFGVPTDIDGNGRVLILFTRAVNEMTAPGAASYVAGFFYGRDLFPTRDADGLNACAGSNFAEILYMLAPDPTGSINGHTRTREFLNERTVGVLAHELQHLVSASRRLRVLGVQQWNEEFWLNEGLSHVAEELMFFASTPHSPGQGITIDMLRNGAGVLTRFNQYQSTNFGRFASYLRSPDAASPINGSDVATRGASWAFLRYAADRSGVPQPELWRRLVDSDVTGYTNLMSALGGSPLSWMHDWAVALYVDDLGQLPVSSRFRQPSWNYRSIMPAFASNSGVYPLTVTDLKPGAGGEARFELAAAGAGVARFRVAAGSDARIRVTSGGSPPPPELRFTILRTR